MRKDRYLVTFAKLLRPLHKLLVKSGLDYDVAKDVLSECNNGMLDKRTYVCVEQSKLKAFLCANLRFRIRKAKQKDFRKHAVVARLSDSELETDYDSVVFVPVKGPLQSEKIPDEECPFCFKANLNEYGACAMCKTIVPSYIRIHRNVYAMSKESLAIEFDFDTPTDIHKALARLTPFEQKVVCWIGMGNESLESFGELTSAKRTTIWRVWSEAKEKLQRYLHAYNPKGTLTTRTQKQFAKALQVSKTDNTN